MPCFGAFCPLPMRLGGSREEGWSPEDHARLANDLAAAKRTAPLAVLRYQQSGSTITITNYLGQNSSDVAAAPTPAVVSTGVARFTFPRSFKDPYGIERAIKISHGAGSSNFAPAPIEVTAPNVIVVRIIDATGGAHDGQATVVVW